MPDVHIGVVSSDLGAGGQVAGGNRRLLGDQAFWGQRPFTRRARDGGGGNNRWLWPESGCPLD